VRTISANRACGSRTELAWVSTLPASAADAFSAARFRVVTFSVLSSAVLAKVLNAVVWDSRNVLLEFMYCSTFGTI
jgi:hypothetical protein